MRPVTNQKTNCRNSPLVRASSLMKNVTNPKPAFPRQNKGPRETPSKIDSRWEKRARTPRITKVHPWLLRIAFDRSRSAPAHGLPCSLCAFAGASRRVALKTILSRTHAPGESFPLPHSRPGRRRCNRFVLAGARILSRTHAPGESFPLTQPQPDTRRRKRFVRFCTR